MYYDEFSQISFERYKCIFKTRRLNWMYVAKLPMLYLTKTFCQISLIRIITSMHVDLKNNLVPWKKWVPLRTRICEKSIGEIFLVISCKFCMYYDNITANLSLKLVRYNNLSLLFMIIPLLTLRKGTRTLVFSKSRRMLAAIPIRLITRCYWPSKHQRIKKSVFFLQRTCPCSGSVAHEQNKNSSFKNIYIK